MNEHAAQELQNHLAQTLGQSLEMRLDEYFVHLYVQSQQVPAILEILRDNFGINYLANLTAVDYDEEFEVVYHLYGIPDKGWKISLKTRVPRSAAILPSVTDIYPTADWQEREIFDLMGIGFEKHPNLVRILLPEGFEGYPLRKDFRKEG